LKSLPKYSIINITSVYGSSPLEHPATTPEYQNCSFSLLFLLVLVILINKVFKVVYSRPKKYDLSILHLQARLMLLRIYIYQKLILLFKCLKLSFRNIFCNRPFTNGTFHLLSG
jgi:hypothetical protein